ncbi:MAG: phosphoribosylformylglycinamidine synthase, partial [Betaproteobacteria bacterium]|nr:phosphoribosylformylglycinamidine synthase [Betaproteobacteria bacterium]
MAHLSAFTGGVAPEAESKIPPETLRALRCNANFAVCEIFFTETAAPLAAAENTLLQKLIGATGEFCAAAENAAEQNKPAAALIIPHFGMVSPWSSKASELLKHCGLDSVRRIERGIFIRGGGAESAEMLADRMTQTVLRPPDLEKWRKLFAAPPPRPSKKIGADKKSLARANAELGLALGESELAHLRQLYARLKRAPTEAELIMFANANSEHCRHKIFRAKDGGESLMDMIRKTHAASPDGVITAFSDNAAIIRAAAGEEFAPDADGIWRRGTGGLFLVAKAETHNHPTAISPFSGAATGGGGEIRDEAAAGRGAATRAGFAGFIVSRLSGLATDLAATHAPSPHFASPLQIMIDGPLGAAEYCNEFGRPSLGGFFRTFESAADGRNFGFHKPLMLAGGLGHMRAGGEGKKPLPPGTKIIQLGGPGFRIGMGGGAASSRDSDGGDFASVQRGCADMQRRAQEVIDVCRRMPGGMFLSLHDVGAGGLANAVIEMVHEGGAGARISLSAIPVEDRSLSPAEIWCNESQERYVLALAPPQLEKFAAICARESCPFAVIGETAADGKIVLADENGAAFADLPLAEVLDGVAIPAAVAEKLSAPKTAEVRPRMEL